MTPRLPFSFSVYLSPLCLLFHYSHWFLPFRNSHSLSVFSSLSQTVSSTLSSSTFPLQSSLWLSPPLVQGRGNLRYLSADVKPCTAPLCTPLCWDADKRHCLATLPQACIFQINRCSLTRTHTHLRTHTLQPPSSLQKFYRCTASKRPAPPKFQHSRASLLSRTSFLCFRCSKAVHIGLFISPLM